MSQQTQRRGSHSIVDKYRGHAFVGGVFVGMTMVSLGFALIILALSVDTRPPAPYLASNTDRFVVAGVALATLFVGYLIVRWSAKVVGW